MLKNVIAPVQAWFLSQGKCVGCGKELPKKDGPGLQKISCMCGRIYMYDAKGGKYRRATFDEIR
ncbi:hypothetical protein ACFL1A_02440 [Patescibacteria group bacterium]